MKCVDVIIQDHSTIRKGLDILDMMVGEMEAGRRIEIADAIKMADFLQLFVDGYHFTAEENILFPLLLRATPDDSPLHQMISEHAEERTLLTHIQDALKSKRAMDFVRISRRLSLLLRNQFREEDVILSDLAKRSLSNEEDTTIVTEFMKRRIQVENHPSLAQLEWKYTSQLQAGTPNPARQLARAQGANSYRS
jgi:hemerythrin-like domain-containing protein